jgi:putative membrane protein
VFTRSGITELAIRWLMLVFAVWLAARIVDGIYLNGWTSTLLVAGILGLLNLTLKPVLLLLSLPVTLVTFGLFVIVINAVLLSITDWLANNLFDISFSVDGFWAALLGAILISIASVILGWFVHPREIARNLTGGGGW